MSSKQKASKGSAGRDMRLKQALKANLQRRKAQARARAGGNDLEDENNKAGRGSAGEAGQDG